MSDPLVLALAASEGPLGGLLAGFEEEGVPLEIEPAQGTAGELARRAAGRAALGVGIGADGACVALVLAAAPGKPYLGAPASDARAFAQDAARVVARRPLRQP